MTLRSAFFWVVVAVWTSPALAANEDFESATRLFQEGAYAEALGSYLEIIDSGLESGNLHYNIANCYFKLNRLGPAILHYERAKRLLGNDEDLEVNLELANLRTVDRITPLPEFWLVRAARWSSFVLPAKLLWSIVGAAWLLSAALVALMIMRWPPLRRLGVPVCLGLLLLVAAGAGLLAGQSFFTAREGVVLAAEVRVLSAPGEGVEVFRIHEGTKFRVDAESGDWLEIVLTDGKVGWLKRGDIAEI